jgi:leucyl-tRNA---protein transferase
MRQEPILSTRFFFATGLMPCPYLPGRLERRLVTELGGNNASRMHDILSNAGFRRSHDIAYAPACPDCDECKAVRVIVGKYQPSRSMRRIINANSDLSTEIVSPLATDEQYELFAAYQGARHGSGEMARMDGADYQALVENSPVETQLVEFRDGKERLIACCLVDYLSDGVSAVYSFFDPDQTRRSLGSLMILWTIRRAAELRLPYAYLGYWIANCRKMSYKARFRPVEVHQPLGWVRYDEPALESDSTD